MWRQTCLKHTPQRVIRSRIVLSRLFADHCVECAASPGSATLRTLLVANLQTTSRNNFAGSVDGQPKSKQPISQESGFRIISKSHKKAQARSYFELHGFQEINT